MSLEGQEWRERRVKITSAFTTGKMKMMFEIVDLIGDKLIEVVGENLKSREEIEMRQLAGCFTADVIGNYK